MTWHSIGLALRSVTWAALLPGLFAGYLPWRYFGLRDVRIELSDPPHLVGLASITVGVILLAACIWEFATRGRGTLSPLDPPRQLVVRGLYRYVRNPIYVALVAVILGQAALFGDPRLLVYGVMVGLGFHAFVVGYEEPELVRTFGTEYEDFSANVPRWIPRLTPWRAVRRPNHS